MQEIITQHWRPTRKHIRSFLKILNVMKNITLHQIYQKKGFIRVKEKLKPELC